MTTYEITKEDCDELLECARYGEDENIIIYLDAGVDVNYQDDGGNTALHRACANGHLRVATLLVERGAKFLKNHSSSTPLHWAALNGHKEIVSLLMEKFNKDVDIYEKNDLGKSAFSEAIGNGHEEVARMMLNHDSAEPPADFQMYSESESEDDADGDLVDDETIKKAAEEETAYQSNDVDASEAPDHSTTPDVE